MYIRISNELLRLAYGLVRYSLALIFIWFGLLKIIDRSPLTELMGESILWVPSDIFIHLLGVTDLLVGIGLFAGIAFNQTLKMIWPNVAGTFLILVVGDNASPEKLWSIFLESPGSNAVVMASVGEFTVKAIALAIGGFGRADAKEGRAAKRRSGFLHTPNCTVGQRHTKSVRLQIAGGTRSSGPSPSIRLHNILCRHRLQRH